jgi:hypothetical protein
MTNCLHLTKKTETREVCYATRYEPAVIEFREYCPICGETSETDETLETDIVQFLKGLTEVVISDIDRQDYPDFCDSFLASAKNNGQELSEMELDYINENCLEWINEMALLQFAEGG